MNFKRARRWRYDGWAVLIRGAKAPLGWTLCTTRDECRRLMHERWTLTGMKGDADVVKVKINLEVVR